MSSCVTKHACGRQTDRLADRRQLWERAIIAAVTVKIGPLFSSVLETYWTRSGAGAERAKNLVSGSGALSECEKNWLERKREVAERATERGSGLTIMGLSGERKFCRSDSARMLCSYASYSRRSKRVPSFVSETFFRTTYRFRDKGVQRCKVNHDFGSSAQVRYRPTSAAITASACKI